MIRFGIGTQSAPHSVGGTPSYRPYRVSSGSMSFSRRWSASGSSSMTIATSSRAAAERRRDVGERRARRAARSRRGGRADAGRLTGTRGGAWPWRPYPSGDDPRSRRRARAVVARCLHGPAAGPGAEPDGFVVVADGDERIHFLDWGGPTADATPASLLVHGLLQPAWSWTPVARRLAARPAHGRRWTCAATACPTRRPTGYDLDALAADVVAVAEGSGRARRGGRVVLAGHGFGAIVAAAAAAATRRALRRPRPRRRRLGVASRRPTGRRRRRVPARPRRAARGPALDGRLPRRPARRSTRRPGTPTRSARRATRSSRRRPGASSAPRPHASRRASGRCSRTTRPPALAAVGAPVTALVALGAGDADARLAELRRTAAARAAAGRPPIRVAGFPRDGHNLMRYRPDEVTAAILGRVSDAGARDRGPRPPHPERRCTSSTRRPTSPTTSAPRRILGVQVPANEVAERAETDPRDARGRRRLRRSSRRPSTATAPITAVHDPGLARASSRRPGPRCGAQGHPRRSSSPTRHPNVRDVRGHVPRPSPARAASRHRRRRAGLLGPRLGDAARRRDVRGRARGRRRGADDRRPRARRRARGLRPVPAARPPRRALDVRRLLLLQQRRDRGRGDRPARPASGSRSSTSTTTTATARSRSSGAAATSCYVSLHADPDRQYPYFLGWADETGEGDGRGREPEHPAAGRADERGVPRGARPRRSRRSRPSRARSSSSRSASTPTASTRSATSR